VVGRCSFVISSTTVCKCMVWTGHLCGSGIRGTGEGQFMCPTSVAVSDGEVFVSDYFNQSVKVYF
jgi:hypothetical protein